MKYTMLAGVIAGGLTSAVAMGAGAPKETPELVAKGKAAFATNCATCHGEKGDANSPVAAAMNPKPRNLVADKFKAGESVDEIFKTVSSGLPGTAMVGFAQIPEADRWGLAYFIKSLRAGGKK